MVAAAAAPTVAAFVIEVSSWRVVFLLAAPIALVAFIAAIVFDLGPELAVGMVLLGAAPGGTTANLANNINVTATFNFDQGWDTFIYEAPFYASGATESVFSLT